MLNCNYLRPTKTIPCYLANNPGMFYQKYWSTKCELMEKVRYNDSCMQDILLEMRQRKILGKDEYEMLKLRFFGSEGDTHGWTLEKIGKYFGVTKERVRQCEEWAKYRINEYSDLGTCR